MEPTKRGYESAWTTYRFNQIISQCWGDTSAPEQRDYIEACRRVEEGGLFR